ncbi:Olfactory receptor 6C75 [Chelonia mydas]|uniref:Olfactory receptor 6C75 n=1 Tax=Chelonia mydas TaxID=8469 RepID=M7BZR5_CHEMY|nr:Olfactory receptor 6C75 [Chelonia mydas]
MGKGEGENQTSITEFILLGFGNVPELQVLLLLLPVIYVVTVAGNILIIVLVASDQHLHTPMYFFLGNLSCLETCYISTILPRLLASLLTGNRTISVNGCFIQLHFFGSLEGAECYLLAAMSYDRYLAICKPLHYAAHVVVLRDLNKALSVFYIVLTPLANPLIYSLRNREVKEAMRKAIQTMRHSQKFRWIDR